jgi:hypothetical protein
VSKDDMWDEVPPPKKKSLLKDDNDFIVTWLLGALFIGLLVWFVMYGYVSVLNAAYDASSLISK